MNALELADIQAFKTDKLTMWERNSTATMLRQQNETIESQGKINRALTERIVELEAELKLIDELVRGKK